MSKMSHMSRIDWHSNPSRLFLVILAVCFLQACSRGELVASADKPLGMQVKLFSVRSTTIVSSSDFVASLHSRRSVTLQPRIQGHITQILVKTGDEVAAEKPIIQIDPSEQQARVNSVSAVAKAAQDKVENVKAMLKSLKAQRISLLSDLQFHQQEYERYSELAKQGAVSIQIRDQYGNKLTTARADLDSMNAQIQGQKFAVAEAEKSLLQAQANNKQQLVYLQYFKIIAPFAGTVGDIPVKVGDYVNTSTQLTTITQNRPLEVNIFVPIEQAQQLRLEMPVHLVDVQGRSIGTSQIFFIAPNVTNGTQTLLVKSLFKNSKGQLRADQFVRARVIWDNQPGILIPTTAVSHVAGKTFVYVAQTQGQSQMIAKLKPVQLGNIWGNSYQVVSGLQAGEKIVVSGILNLSDGTPITPRQ